MVRKAQSLECLRIPSIEIKGDWVYLKPSNFRKKKKASRFSSSLMHRKRSFNIPTVPKQSLLRTSSSSYSNLLDAATDTAVEVISHSAPAASPSGLDATERNEDMFIFGARKVSAGTLRNVVVFLFLLFTTISSYHRDIQSSHISFVSKRSPKDGVSLKNNNNRLGSAMIGSVTEVLSPILPFAGGMDLRRDGNLRRWFGLVLNKHSIDSSHAENLEALLSPNLKEKGLFSRGGSTHVVNNKGTRPRENKINDSMVLSLSTSDSFIAQDDIAKMTLNDISLLFRYVIESGREGFDSKKFLSKGNGGEPMSHRMLQVMKSIDIATSKSRSDTILPARTKKIQQDLSVDKKDDNAPLGSEVGFGDVDALQFCAAMRVFGEWRLLRQVPPGYKGYAVGMSLGHKDIVQNVAQIENAVHWWIRNQAEMKASTEISQDTREKHVQERRLESPTLRQLLESEIIMDIHPTSKLPYLKDRSAAMGLLWVRRQLQYQTSIFRNVLSVPQVFPSIIHAVADAYSEVYGGLHGWAVQKIFNYSFQAAPEAEVIFRHMDPELLTRVRKAAAAERYDDDTILLKKKNVKNFEANNMASIESDEPHPSRDLHMPHHGKKNAIESSHEENPLIKLGSHLASEWDNLGRNMGGELDKIGRHIGAEFEKITCGIGKVFNDKGTENCDIKISPKIKKGTRKEQIGLSGDSMEKYINNKMTLHAKEQIASYLRVAQPLLRDLTGLFTEMNMDDPTKV